MAARDLQFPSDFVFGSATASYQIEGAVAEGGRGPSIWDTFSHTPGKVVNGDTGDVACDHYHRLDADLDLMASYHLDAYRFSIAWPRIQPTGSGPANPEGIAFYDRLIDGLLERGIAPTCTLYHWDLPQALEDAGGWPHRDTAERFAEYAALCGEAFGDRIRQWTTLNEPWCSTYLGYAMGTHAPGRRDPVDALRAAHTLNLAHGKAVQALRQVVRTDPSYSITFNLVTAKPASESPEDAAVVAKVQQLNNRIFTSPVLFGRYDDLLLETTAPYTDWGFVRDGDLADIHQPLDVLGLNWYTPQTYRHVPPRPLGFGEEWVPTANIGIDDVEDVTDALDLPRTDMGWVIDPDALEQQLRAMADEFPGMPLVITENGCAYDDPVVDGRCHDGRRLDYLHAHLAAVHRAREAGAPVVGYYVWSLMDNFEWAEGYAKRFGITHVDYETQVRTPRDSALWYARLATTHTLEDPAARGDGTDA